MDFDRDVLVEKQIQSLSECLTYLQDDRPSITWIDIRGMGDTELFRELARIFKLHPLAIEDLANAPQRAKADAYPEQQLVIGRMIHAREDGSIRSEQLGILFGQGFVVTVQEDPDGDPLDAVRQRIRSGRGSIRNLGADYLAYAILDAAIDGFYPVLEMLGERLEALELDVSELKATDPKPIYNLKRELLLVRRGIWPQRELLGSLLREQTTSLFSEATRVYLRDTYDHTVQVMDMVETFREITSSVMDLYMTGVSNRLNETMKVLTILSSIFLPLTFIAGVYGMNFDTDVSPMNMPELKWRYGYLFSLGAMLASVIVLLWYYRRRGWLGGPSASL